MLTASRISEVRLRPVGRVVGGREAAFDDNWSAVVACIELDPDRFSAESLAGLQDFSHAEIVFLFDQVDPQNIVAGARHPRGREDLPCVGIFAQRGRSRPNRIGVSVCEIVSVDGTSLTVRGLDAIDGSPVLDIKPVMKGFLPRTSVHQPSWADEIMREYW